MITNLLSTEFIFFWAIVLLVSTTLIFIFKKDNSLEIIDDENRECKLGLKKSYLKLWTVFKLRPMLILNLILLTFYVSRNNNGCEIQQFSGKYHFLLQQRRVETFLDYVVNFEEFSIIKLCEA